MSFPYSSYTELSPPFVSLFGTAPSLSEVEARESAFMPEDSTPPPSRSYPLLRTYSLDPSFLANYPLPSHACLADDMSTMSSVIWDSPSPSEQETFLNGPLVETYSPNDLAFAPEAFSPGHHVSYSTDSSYTRMFRGRKSKAASEALDELRPYACDICRAAFARSHDRDRHKRSHTGETPYRCHGCGTGFKRPDARKRHWERDPACAQEDWHRVKHTPEGAKRRARQKAKPLKKQIEI